MKPRGNRRVLVISPHPDDEAIGCGGSIAKHVAQGDAVHVIFLTSGEKGVQNRPPHQIRAMRENEAERARQMLGIETIEFYREPDGELRPHRKLIQRLAAKLHEWQPVLVYAPHPDESHPDHRAAFRILQRAVKQAAPFTRILLYEVWTPLARMDEIVDITDHVKTKRAAIRAHRSQCAVLDFATAILGLNRYRGEMFCWPEGEYAEVFVDLRSHVK